MLTALKELGRYLVESGERGGLDDYLDNDKLENYETLIVVRFNRDDGGYAFDGVDLMDLGGYEPDVLYKWGSPRGGDWTPTSRVTRIHSLEEKQDPETSKDTITRVFEQWYGKVDIDDPMVTEVLQEFEEHEEEIRSAVKSKYESVENQDACVLTVRYEDENGEWQFIRKFDVFVNALKTKIAEKWANKYDVESQSEEDVCVLCREEKKVMGFAFPFAFYTVDNARYAPDFDQSMSWKNLPLCEDCALDLRVGQIFAESNSSSFYIGEPLEYYVIPDFPFGYPNESIMSRIRRGKKESEYSFMNAEEFYADPKLSKNQEYTLNLDFVFYETEQSSHTIQKYVEDVAPSWVRECDKTLKRVYADVYGDFDLEKQDYYLQDTGQLQELDSLIYRTLPSNYGSPEAFRNDALDLTEKILKGEKIERNRLLSLFVPEIISRFRQNENHRGYTARTFLFLNFLVKLGILEDTDLKSYEEIMDDWSKGVNEELEEFFDTFPVAFDSPEKRAVFVEGVLAQHLMDVQSMVRQSEDPPLRKKLSGLRLDQKRARRLLPDLFHDLDVYDRKSDYPVEYRDLRQTAATYFAEADNNEEGWDIDEDEVRYYFALGLSLNRVFKTDSEEEPQKQEA